MPHITNPKRHFTRDYERFISYPAAACHNCKTGFLVFEFIKIFSDKIVYKFCCDHCVTEKTLSCSKREMKSIIKNLLKGGHGIAWVDLFYMLRLSTEVGSVHYTLTDKQIFDKYVRELETYIKRIKKWNFWYKWRKHEN